MKILATGASGFLGRACMMWAPQHDWTVYSRDERKQELCKRTSYGAGARYVLGDVTDRDRLLQAARGHDAIIHMAAIKYIPEAEYNVNECIKVNIEGSKSVLWAAQQLGITVVGVSTDKACAAINVYGATKMLMERLFSEAARNGLRSYTVRYGNVVGSTGSVIPLFVRQIQEQGYVTVTDPLMTRYWMSAQEAVNVVLTPLTDRVHMGSTVVYEPRSMSIGDLARVIAGDNIKVIGVRPGERRYEAIINEFESTRAKFRNENTHLLDSYYELHGVGHAEALSEPFELRSDTTARPLMENELLEMIQDAEGLQI